MAIQPNQTEADATIAAGAGLATPKKVGDGIPFVVVPHGYSVVDLERTLAKPFRPKGSETALDVESFVALVLLDKGPSTRIYFRGTDRPAFRAVFNASSAAAPDFEDHSVDYLCPLSDEWVEWSGKNRQAMKQADFAAFIERNAVDVSEPGSAEMVQMARTFEAKKGVDFKSGVSLKDGNVQFTFNETTAAKMGETGQFEVPDEFTIAIPVFKAGAGIAAERFPIKAKLRYRIDTSLVLWYELIKPEKVMDVAVGDLRKKVESELGSKSYNTSF